ncbi:uncharacterized protein [Struthio camelus]|uniref:uncharacterized protein n=1 Tax=Struthio camelus TaxID=8801 RepID=UPI003603E659
MGRFSPSSFLELAPLLRFTLQLCLIYIMVRLTRLRRPRGRTRRQRSVLRTSPEKQSAFLMMKEEPTESSLTLERRASMEALAVNPLPLRAPLASFSSFDSSLLGTSSSSSLASLSSSPEGAAALAPAAQALLPCLGADGRQPEEGATHPAVGLGPACVVPVRLAAPAPLGPSPWPAAALGVKKRDVWPLTDLEVWHHLSSLLPGGPLLGPCLGQEQGMELGCGAGCPRDGDRLGAACGRRRGKEKLRAMSQEQMGHHGWGNHRATLEKPRRAHPSRIQGLLLGRSAPRDGAPRNYLSPQSESLAPWQPPSLEKILSTLLSTLQASQAVCERQHQLLTAVLARLRGGAWPMGRDVVRTDPQDLLRYGCALGSSPRPREQSTWKELPSLPALPICAVPRRYQAVEKALCFDPKVSSKEVHGWHHGEQVRG